MGEYPPEAVGLWTWACPALPLVFLALVALVGLIRRRRC